MPGRVKAHHLAHGNQHTHQHLKPIPRLSHVRRQDAALPPPPPAPAPTPTLSPTGGGSLFENDHADPKDFILNKQTITWLIVISIIVLATLITVTCLLCRCTRRRKHPHGVKRHPSGRRWHPNLEVKDGRNDFQAWNRHAPPRPSLAEQGGFRGGDERLDTWESGDSVAPLRPGNVRMGVANGSAVMEPVVVDYGAGPAEGPKKRSRYYSSLNSGRSSIWKRISQIGRAY